MDSEKFKAAKESPGATIFAFVFTAAILNGALWWGGEAVIWLILGIALLFLLGYALIGLIRLLSDLFGGRL